jgi:hypothetical protein
VIKGDKLSDVAVGLPDKEAFLWKVGKWDRRLDWKKCKFFITMALFPVASCGILK